ncbi:MAG: AGE family epimerase/isomerase [Thermoproteota archaeon]
MSEKVNVDNLINLYKSALLNDVVPFWLKHSLDHEYGGYLHFLDRDGSVYSTDKGMWIQCREAWLFSKLYNTVEKRKEWLNAARLGYEFITKHGFDSDGRMFFELTREGKPLRKRRYLFAECFGVMAFAEYYKATGKEEALQRAKETYKLVVRLHKNPDASTPPKIFPQTRAMKSLAMQFMLICISQEIRKVDSDPLYEEVINDSLYQILNHFLKREKRALLENVGPNGEYLDSPEGRCVNPGHSIEVSWFIMHEGIHRNDSSLIDTALKILEWSLELGWDKMHGGILYFVDVEGKPPAQLEHDMKLWWPHTEALYALLLAYYLTKEEKYASWYKKVHDFTFSHFPDPEYGEWFGYLHYDNTIANRLKGSLWKGPFHIPRALLQGWKLLEKMKNPSLELDV